MIITLLCFLIMLINLAVFAVYLIFLYSKRRFYLHDNRGHATVILAFSNILMLLWGFVVISIPATDIFGLTLAIFLIPTAVCSYSAIAGSVVFGKNEYQRCVYKLSIFLIPKKYELKNLVGYRSGVKEITERYGTRAHEVQKERIYVYTLLFSDNSWTLLRFTSRHDPKAAQLREQICQIGLPNLDKI